MDKSQFDLCIVRNFLDKEFCRKLIAEMRRARATAAVTYGKGKASVDERVRRVRQVSVSLETVADVTRRLEDERTHVAEHFGISLTSFEEPQFLCYRAGDFFVAHQDGNTGLIQLETDRSRRISVTIFLNNQSAQPQPETYSGGSLVFSDWRRQTRREVCGEAGMFLAFRSETTHEVTPVTDGERYALVSWYLGE